MHLLTKFLVVLAAVAGIALSSLTISFAVNNRAVLNDYERVYTELDAQRAVNQEAAAQAAAAREALQAKISELQSNETALASQINSLQGEVGDLRRDKLTAEQSVTSLQNQITQLNETNRLLTELVDRHSSEVVQLRANELNLRQNEIALLDRISDLQSSTESMEATVRSLREQVARLESGEGGGGVAGGGSTSPDVASYVRGSITETRNDDSGSMLARVDLGSEDGLAAGKRLYIVGQRGGQATLVGYFIVQRADLQFADGTVDTAGLGTTPRRGDAVVSNIRR
ncbi:MAG: hypothetical protein AAFX79_08160 [Planctomycetota bacterium]